MTDHTGFPGNVRFRELEEEAARSKLKSKELPEEKRSSTVMELEPKVTTTSNKLEESTHIGLKSIPSWQPYHNRRNVLLSQAS